MVAKIKVTDKMIDAAIKKSDSFGWSTMDDVFSDDDGTNENYCNSCKESCDVFDAKFCPACGKKLSADPEVQEARDEWKQIINAALAAR